MGLKSKSLNTNFRDHGFRICECPINDVIAELANIHDPQCWKRLDDRHFSRGTTREEAIDITSPTRRSSASA
jgi:hypothetical protein